MTDLLELSLLQLRQMLGAGEVSARSYVDDCLTRIAAIDAQIEAWTFLDPDHARAQADALDARRAAGLPLGPLHGVPIGIKDIIDTADMPTENGAAADAGRRPAQDAVLIARLRAAGAVIMGKTVTTELAYFAPGKTRNPYAQDRTPGGSSSGSAAAVAAGMVPAAIGTQTNGSIIRPAAFCGAVGFKPTHGLVPRTGALLQSGPLDTIGPLTRSVADAAALVDVIRGPDPGDPDSRPAAAGALLDTVLSDPPVPPRLAFVRSPVWDRASADTQAVFADLVAMLRGQCEEITLPPSFDDAHRHHRTLMLGGFAHNLAGYAAHADGLSDQMRQALTDAAAVSAGDYLAALSARDALTTELADLLTGYDAVLTPSAPGEAPAVDTTGDPAFNTIWSLLGMPAVTLPLFAGASGLPIGVQLVAARNDDARLLRTARWLDTRVLSDAAGTTDTSV